MEAREKVKFIDRIADKLRDVATELEEFQLQLNLGKAEAEDKYEDAKNKLRSFIHETKGEVDSGVDIGKEKMSELRSQLEALNVQLALGKADTLDKFEEQKKKILKAIHELEVGIKTNKELNRAYAYTLIQLDMFKVQMEILEDRYKEGKKDFKDTLEKGKEELNAFVNKIRSKSAEEKRESRWEHFQDEISEAFNHLRNAFSK